MPRGRQGFLQEADLMADFSAADALIALKAGNARFVAGATELHKRWPSASQLADGQRPFAVILGCSDSRVPVEIIFDQAPGNLFVVRLAGNVLNGHALGSIEYAVDVLKSSLIVVLGHENCGAVAAAMAYVRDGTRQKGHIQELVESVAPAARATRDASQDWYGDAIARNVALNVAALSAESRIISDAAGCGNVQVVGGLYSVRTGRVTFA